MADPKHFNLPFRVDSQTGHLSTVTQDSVDDIANCIEMAILVEPGMRAEVPNFGTPSQLFKLQPLSLETILVSVYKYEQRADVLLSQIPGYLNDPLVDKIEAVLTVRAALNNVSG